MSLFLPHKLQPLSRKHLLMLIFLDLRGSLRLSRQTRQHTPRLCLRGWTESVYPGPSASLSCVRHRPALMKQCHDECGGEMWTIASSFPGSQWLLHLPVCCLLVSLLVDFFVSRRIGLLASLQLIWLVSRAVLWFVMRVKVTGKEGGASCSVCVSAQVQVNSQGHLVPDS